MKKSFITFMLLLTAICSWAQMSKASEEKPIAPIIVEGTLEGVPDGPVIMVQERRGGDYRLFPKNRRGNGYYKKW